MAEQTHAPENGKNAHNKGRSGHEGPTGSGSAPEETRQFAEATGETGKRAARAGADLAQRQVETARQTLQLGAEATARTFERFAQSMTEAFSWRGAADGAGSRAIAENIEAASKAGTGLTLLAQEAARECLELTRQAMRTNLEAVQGLASCRSMQDWASVQTKLVRDNLEHAVRAGQAVADASRRNLEDVARTIEHEDRRQASA